MTTTVVIAFAAAAILFIMLIVVLIVCKREAKKRTDSITAIEHRLKEVTKVLADSNKIKTDTIDRGAVSGMEELVQAIEKLATKKESEEEITDADWALESSYDEISFDFLEERDLYDIETDDLVDLVDEDILIGSDYNTGRSGKKYTAEELETLIKE